MPEQFSIDSNIFQSFASVCRLPFAPVLAHRQWQPADHPRPASTQHAAWLWPLSPQLPGYSIANQKQSGIVSRLACFQCFQCHISIKIIISIVFLSGRIVELHVSRLLSLLCSSLAPSWDHVAPGRSRMAEFHISKHRRP